ncbi:DUF1543 domain-containing protein [Sphingomonas sp. CGMCC 1.13654]|uniref:DUF1543 domain-containing protein n=1 Tax=Sphingomonas chungangi TaxID=2683589 RepID=A0A838LGX2_9SPHN|nr:DUF1543 domain-containing protein [Sphingomonas chungangi]MBA2936668.1 DUF1543 domain-containing protein [Sphingomonas chungangi]MVW56053.1 DUF1543 domain-containing protein [Sphingomonas chungangi]
MKLFAVYVGGEHAAANIELHDMRFIVAPTLRDTFSELRRQWWGKPGSLHIDCWAEIDQADGYDVSLRPEPFQGSEHLFFVNLGGYEPGEFTERHKSVFVVAETEAKAKARALKTVTGWSLLHRDNLYEAEQAFALDQVAGSSRLHLHLTRSQEPRELAFTCDYMPIRKRD